MAASEPSVWDITQLLTAEYNNLRAEIIKLTELQFQITAVTVVAFGTVMSAGLQIRNAAILLVYPLLALILGVAWLHYAHLIARVAAYLRILEDRVGHQNLGWEHFVQHHPLSRRHLAYWGIRAIFVVSSILALLGSLTVPSHGMGASALYALACGVTITIAVVFSVWREPSPELSGAARA